jgi:predicted esterase
MNGRAVVGMVVLAAWATLARADEEPTTGFLPEVAVKLPTRLDWQFVAAALVPVPPRGPVRMPADYESARQRYQLYVPPGYKPTRPWPLILFLSPGDDPMGWPSWQKLCEEHEVFFCAAYGAGNNCPAARRAHLVLDVLDDVRRHYRIDPTRTYLAGFDGGARLACTLAFCLTEYVGGVVAIGGGSVPQGLDYLRHRAGDRLSVAVVTGADDLERRHSEVYLYPLLSDLGVRSRLWVVPKAGHEVAPPAVLGEVHDWLETDLPRRLRDVREHPALAVAPDEVLLRSVQAERIVAAAEAELRYSQHVYRGAALLQGVVARWDSTDAADRAREMLKAIDDDPRQRERLHRQRAGEEQRTLAAQARALQRLGETRAARQTWEQLARTHAGTPQAEHAAAEARRLTDLLAGRPFLGLQFEGATTVVREVVPHGPAARAGLRRGDQLVKLDGAATASPGDVRAALSGRKPGDKLTLQVRRGGESLELPVEVGAHPPAEKD